MLRKLAPYLLFAVYKIFFWTWRIRVHETEEVRELVKNNKSFIIAHWHGHELGILHLLKRYHVACMISTSKDGDLMNKAVQLLGAETVRGSSTRQGTQALKGILRLSKKGRRPSVAVDGPTGPIYKVKPGVFQISRLAQVPIVPISFHSSRSHIFEKSWNKSELPLPFSTITVLWGSSVEAVKKSDDSRSDELSLELEQKLHATRKGATELANGQSEVF